MKRRRLLPRRTVSYCCRRLWDVVINLLAAAMDIADAKPASKKVGNKRKVEKRRGKKSSIVFPMRGPKRNKK